MTKDSRSHIRVSEFRFEIPRRTSEGHFSVPRHQIGWAEYFVDESTGEKYELSYVLEQLQAQGWDVHDLLKGKGQFRDTVDRLPLPYGGQFRPGDPTTRDA